MTYAVKEAFLTLQGEGVQSGSRAVFLRFAGCNLWSGREQDRATAQCNFCDTDFVGTDGDGRRQVRRRRGARRPCRGAVGRGATSAAGGDHRRRADAPARRGAGRRAARRAASGSRSRATARLPATPGIDWLCISPKAGTEVVQRSGDELKLVWPQPGIDPAELEQWDFDHFLVQPMDCERPRGGDRRGDRAGDGAAAAGACRCRRTRWSGCPRAGRWSQLVPARAARRRTLPGRLARCCADVARAVAGVAPRWFEPALSSCHR